MITLNIKMTYLSKETTKGTNFFQKNIEEKREVTQKRVEHKRGMRKLRKKYEYSLYYIEN